VNEAADVRRPRDVPTFFECVIGYRAWSADTRDQLWPLSSARRPWLPGINTARCNCAGGNSLRFEWLWHEGRRVLEPAPEHAAPQPDCECGLYSWRRPPTAWSVTPARDGDRLAVGAAASWGHLQVHAEGFRAEHACIVTLAYHHDTPPGEMAALERIAARYRVDLVPLADLEQAASRHGAPLPDALRPSNRRVAGAEPPADAETQAARNAVSLMDVPPDGASSIRPRRTTPPLLWSMVSKPHHRIGHHALTAVIGVVALAIGLLSLWHPTSGWAFGTPHTSDAPGVLGVNFLVIPVVLLGLAARRIWWALSLDLEAWRRHGHHHTQ
jgi:hypothetical protein